MATPFPSALDDNTTLPNPSANNPTNNPSLSAGQTNQNDSIKAIEKKLGTGSSTAAANQVLRGTGAGTTAFGALNLATDVTGALPVASGGTGSTTQNFVDLTTNQTVNGTKVMTGLQDKGSQLFNVKAYGAKVDGTTNDNAALTAAISAAQTAGGGVVFIPAGTMVTTGSFSMPSNVRIQGAGKTATIIKGSAGSTATFLFNGASGNNVVNAGLEALTIDQQNTASAAGVSMYYFSNITFRQVKFANSAFKFIQSGVNTQTTIDNDHLNIVECDFMTHAGNTYESVTLANTNHIVIDRCYWNNSNFSVLLYQLCNYITFRDTTFNNITGTGTVSAITYSLSCNEIDIIRCRFIAPISGTSTGYAIQGANQSDHGAFGYTSVVGFRTDHCYVQGGLIGIQIGAVRGYTDTGSVIEQAWNAGVVINAGNSPVNTPSRDISFNGTTVRNCNQANTSALIHPGLLINGIPATSGSTYNLRLNGVSIYDTQGTPTQQYPVTFDGANAPSTSYPVSGITATGSQLQYYAPATMPFSLGDGATIGSAITITDAMNGNIGVNQTNPQYPLDVNGDVRVGVGGTTPNLRFGDSGVFNGSSGALRAWSNFAGKQFQWFNANAAALKAAMNMDTGILSGSGLNPLADSTTAVQIQNSIGANIINVDTTNKRVGIGNTAPAVPLDVTGTVNATSYQSSGYATKTLLYNGFAQLSANFNSAANTTTQVVGNLLITLPVIAKSCDVKITIQMYSTFGVGNTNVYGSIGTVATGLGNTTLANVYAGGAQQQNTWVNTAWIQGLNMGTQQYASMTVQNDAGTIISFSANAFRTSILVEIYG